MTAKSWNERSPSLLYIACDDPKPVLERKRVESVQSVGRMLLGSRSARLVRINMP